MSYLPTVADARNTGSSHYFPQLLHVHRQRHPLRRISYRPTSLLELATESHHHGRCPSSTFPSAQTIRLIRPKREVAETTTGEPHTGTCLSGIVRSSSYCP